MKKLSYESKAFIIFLLVQLVLYSCVSMIRLILPTDALEGIYWGSLHDFGTPKHPPLAGWITYITFLIFKKDFFIYLVSQCFILTGLIYTYKTAKIFLNEVESILSVIILSSGCWVYGYITSYYGFNPDTVLLCFLPIITYYGYKCVTENKLFHWILLGFLVGFSCLNKYQTALIVIPLIIWAISFKRELFKSYKPYLSMLIAFIIFLPHLLWLIKYDFFSIMYFEQELNNKGILNHLISPFLFALVQLSSIIGCILVFVLLKLKQKSKFTLSEITDRQKAFFLILMYFVPFIIHIIMGIISGGTMRPRWGFEFLYLTGILLFYFLPVNKISKQNFNFALTLSYMIMLIVFITMGTLFSVEKNYRSRYPVEKITNDLTKEWNKKFNSPLKYIGGYLEWSLPIVIYNFDKNYECLLDTRDYPSPWAKKSDLKKYGAIIISRKKDEVISYVNDDNYIQYNANKNITPTEYTFYVKNALGQQRKYTIYYFMVAPQKD